MSSLDIEQHDRQRSEVKRYVVAQRTAWRDWHPDMVAITDQAQIPDADKVAIESVRVPAMETIPESPQDVVPVGDPENETPFRSEYVPQ
jgi:hypothetical protein